MSILKIILVKIRIELLNFKIAYSASRFTINMILNTGAFISLDGENFDCLLQIFINFQ